MAGVPEEDFQRDTTDNTHTLGRGSASPTIIQQAGSLSSALDSAPTEKSKALLGRASAVSFAIEPARRGLGREGFF